MSCEVNWEKKYPSKRISRWRAESWDKSLFAENNKKEISRFTIFDWIKS